MNKVKKELCVSVFQFILIFLVLSSCVRSGKKINKFTQSVLLGELTFHTLVYLYLFFFCNCFYNVYK